jgi:hypothetical protein
MSAHEFEFSMTCGVLAFAILMVIGIVAGALALYDCFVVAC